MKLMERRVRKKVGMLAVKIKVWEVKCETEDLNCEDIEAETDELWRHWSWDRW
jgi:hypothetical protein